MSDDPSDDGAADPADAGDERGNGPTDPNSEPTTDRDDRDETTETTMTDDTDDGTAGDGTDLRRTLNYVLLAGLSLVALIATLRLYFNVSTAINQWITYEYRSLFQAAFNLAVLLLVSAGMVWQTRRLRG